MSQHDSVDQAVSMPPAADATSLRANGPTWTGHHWATPTPAGVRLVVVGGLTGGRVPSSRIPRQRRPAD